MTMAPRGNILVAITGSKDSRKYFSSHLDDRATVEDAPFTSTLTIARSDSCAFSGHSIGPYTAAMTTVPPQVNLAEPSHCSRKSCSTLSARSSLASRPSRLPAARFRSYSRKPSAPSPRSTEPFIEVQSTSLRFGKEAYECHRGALGLTIKLDDCGCPSKHQIFLKSCSSTRARPSPPRQWGCSAPPKATNLFPIGQRWRRVLLPTRENHENAGIKATLNTTPKASTKFKLSLAEHSTSC
mmetsp:Transcript_12098/g.50270  ORF Transcript_12098/g.50270 Transcript_12098/m.50270 type:complete len:240 (+) Transcript_12098:804-1523(+)